MRSKNLTYLLLFVLVAAQPLAAATAPQSTPLPARPVPIAWQSMLIPPRPSGLWAPEEELSGSAAGQPRGPEDLPVSLRTKFEPALLKQLLQATEDEAVRAIVYMSHQSDLQGMGLSGMDILTRRRTIVSGLQSLADRSQDRVRAILEQGYLEQRVTSFQPLWIVNGIAVTAERAMFWELAAHPDVAHIRQDHLRSLPRTASRASLVGRGSGTARAVAPHSDVQWNVQRIQADRVWEALQITGKGVVVGSMDSGVDWEHPDLRQQYRGYSGKPFVEHAGNWYCATDEGYTYPGDGEGHGTHTMGTIVGQGGIGVAPGAQWIAAKVFNNQGFAYDSWVHDGFQWMLAPNGDPSLAPDIVNNSWGGAAGANQEFLPDVQALRAAGIVPVFAAGNDGPDAETIYSPGSYRESIAVGAVDDGDVIARFSSRGPSPWSEIKPEVVAPGVRILSTLPGGAFGTLNGTSMAAPHVTGLLALMRQANPSMTVEQLESVLIETAMPLGDDHPNNDYGWGLIDAYAAVTRAGSFGYLAGQITDAGDGTPMADASVSVISHGSTTTITAATDAWGRYRLGLSAGSYDLTVAAFGFAAQTVYSIQVITGTTVTQDAALHRLPTGTLRGVVTEASTGVPLEATIRVPGTRAATTSNPADGVYSLTLPRGTHAIRVESTGHRFVSATVAIAEGLTSDYDAALEGAPTILLVDSGVWYNSSQSAYYEAALTELHYLYDRLPIANVDIPPTDAPTIDTLRPYDLVVWSAPQDSPGYIGASEAITRYLQSGGRLLLSGQDVAFWDGGGSGHLWAPYLYQYLKVLYRTDDAASRVLTGEGSLYAGLTLTIAGAGGADNQFYPDVISSADPDYAQSAWSYEQDGSGGQTVGPCLPYRAVFLSFGLEAITDAALRREVLRRGIDWLSAPQQPVGVELKGDSAPQIAGPAERITHTIRLRNIGEQGPDTFALELSGNAWPTTILGSPSISLQACQSTTLQIAVRIPDDAGWHVSDRVTLTGRSSISPTLVDSLSLRTKTPAPLLLVDGARFYHVEGSYQEALDRAGIGYDYHRVKMSWPPDIPTVDTLARYPMVLWYTAYDWYNPLSLEEQAHLIGYLDRGGRLLLSSQDYLYYSYGSILAHDYLGVLDYAEDLGAVHLQGEPKHPIGWGAGPYTLTYGYTNWSDALTPTLEAQVVFRSRGGNPVSLSRLGDSWRTAFSAFSIDALDPDPAATVLGRTVGWLSWLGRSTWQADRRAVSGGSEVAMSCILLNDGWADVAAAHFSATLPQELSLVPGSLSPGAAYHSLTRTIAWQGSLPRYAESTVGFRVRVDDSLPEGAYVAFPAQIGYADHAIVFERPYFLRVDAPDLSTSALSVEPSTAPPGEHLSATLTLRNTGPRDALATITITLPTQASLVGPFEGGQVISGALQWQGQVAGGEELPLRYHLLLGGKGVYWLIHRAQVEDQYGERWTIEARTEVELHKTFMPIIPR